MTEFKYGYFLLLILCSSFYQLSCQRAQAIDQSQAIKLTFNEAVRQADATTGTLALGSGQWLTDGRKNTRIRLTNARLTIKGEGPSATTISRPNQSLGQSSNNKDFFYGAFFEPAPPTEAELDQLEWKNWTKPDGSTFTYSILRRGKLIIKDLTLDCNMHQQNIQPGDKVEHSAMLGFAGSRTVLKTGRWQDKVVYTAFEEVELHNITIKNEGYADAIWISRGYFQPNIGAISLEQIKTVNRVSTKRGSIVFSSPAEQVTIKDCDVHRIELEESSQQNYAKAPRATEVPVLSSWRIEDSEINVLDIIAKGYSTKIEGQDLIVNQQVSLYQVQGTFRNCTFHKSGDPRLFRLKDVRFENVRWVFHPDDNGLVRGIRLTGQYNEDCSATFVRNDFRAVGDFTSGVLVDSEYSRTKTHAVYARFVDCTFDERFGVQANTTAIKAYERGEWIIEGLPAARRSIIQKGNKADIRLRVNNN